MIEMYEKRKREQNDMAKYSNLSIQEAADIGKQHGYL